MRVFATALVAALLVVAVNSASERFNEEHLNMLNDIFAKLQKTREGKEQEFKKMREEKTRLKDQFIKEKDRLQKELQEERARQFQQAKKVSEEQHEQFKGILQEIIMSVSKSEEKKLGFKHLNLLKNISYELEGTNQDSLRHFQEIQLMEDEHHKKVKQTIIEDHENVKKERDQQFKELNEMKIKHKEELHSMFRGVMELLEEPRDCADIFRNGNVKSGIYVIRPESMTQNSYVYCDMQDDGGGWTVIQRREKGKEQEAFHRTDKQYKEGFGKLKGEFWLGNDIISAMTHQQDMELKVLAHDTSGTPLIGLFKTFKVGDAKTDYQLKIDGFVGKIEQYFTKSNLQKFTSLDSNKSAEKSCAVKDGSGWWYPNYCLNTPDPYPNLNGKRNELWALDGKTPVVRIIMQVRPKDFNKKPSV